MPPGKNEQLHYHNNAQQVFYILSGSARFIVDGVEQFIGPNQSIELARGSKHHIFNDGPQDLHILVISEPKAWRQGGSIIFFRSLKLRPDIFITQQEKTLFN